MNMLSSARPIQHSGVHDRWLFGGLILLLFWVPLPLGSNRTWAVGILVLWSQVLLLGSIFAWRHALAEAFTRLAMFKWPLLLLGLFVALPWLQLLPISSGVLAVVSPEALNVERGTAVTRLTLDANQTQIYAGLSFAYFSCFIVALLTVRDAKRLDFMAVSVVIAGVLQALIGVVLFSAGASYRIFYFDIAHTRVFGTFGYHNHLAGYMEMCLSIGIGLMLARLGSEQTQKGNWRHKIAQILAFVLSPKMRLRMMLVIMVIALVLTRSRMGNTGFFASMLIVGVIAIALSRKTAPATIGLIASLVIIDVVIVGTWVGLEKVVNRVSETTISEKVGVKEESVELRTDAARHAVDLIRDFPVFGTGAGSFYNTFLRYRTPRELYWDHAHNDYVELAADNGLLGLAVLGAFVVLSIGVMLKILLRRRASLPRGIAFGVLMTIVSLAIHSSVDFNLQLPANALTLVVILAIGWSANALPRSASGGRSRYKRPEHQIKRRGAV